MPDAVLFDNDGLLLDTEGLWTNAEMSLFERRGRAFGPDDKRAVLGKSGEVAAATLEERLDEPGQGLALLEELEALAFEEFGQEVAAMDGAVELLDALHRAGIPVALVSNSPSKLVARALESAGLSGVFETVVTPEPPLRPKPAPDVYKEACRALGVETAGAMALEDSPTGVAAARAAGITVIGVPSMPGLDLSASDLVAESLADGEVWRMLGLRDAASRPGG
jgi:HAD superfamily hydrolase (TIGR01509 family)